LNLAGIPQGKHSVKVTSDYYGYYENNNGYNESAIVLTYFHILGSSEVEFTIAYSSMEPSSRATPTPSSSPAPTIEPISTPKQPTGFLGTSLPTEYCYAIVAVLGIVVVAGLSVVYFKRLRK
jgi:hypothetical protein